MEDPAAAKGVVRREVVRLMTPGTLTDDALMDGRSDNHLAAVAFHVTKADGYRAALAWVELSTGACVALSGTEQQVVDEAARLRPAEVLIPEQPSGQPHPIGGEADRRGTQDRHAPAGLAVHAPPRPRAGPTPVGRAGHRRVRLQRRRPGRAGHGRRAQSYLEETQKAAGTAHLRPLRRHSVDDFLSIDPASWRSLEVDRTVRTGGTEGSLLSAIDRTRTPMGARTLRQWLRYPLRDAEHIAARQSAIAALLASPSVLADVRESLDGVCDVERIVGRIAVGRAGPRDLAALARCVANLPDFLRRLAQLPAAADVAPDLVQLAPFCAAQAEYLQSAIKSDPAPHLREGGVIAAGFDAELDRLTDLGTNSQRWLAEYQGKLSAETNIPSLKVAYNKVFGYYIEVTNTHKDKAPAGWTRKQTTTTSERYITAELKDFEHDALGARDKSVALEQELFEQVRQALLPHVTTFQELAYAVARVDVLSSLAALAADRRYCRPTVTDDRTLSITDGRHPVLEQQLGPEFVANDVTFADADSLQLITGPNMAGKSTFIRQVALITLLAQVGSYVPAKAATVGLADRLFTRIGASDELHGGQSTFMVEMTETANILNNATDRSLVVLDEIGRGTSTLDGLSLAWAIAEHIAANVGCRTLFATHYHELTDLADRFTGVKNLNVSVREWEESVIFLHRIVEGGTDRSYGIHVARLAGVPRDVLDRARQLLSELAVQHVARPKVSGRRLRAEKDPGQLALFVDPAVELMATLAGTDVDHLSPMAAFELLRAWKAKYRR